MMTEQEVQEAATALILTHNDSYEFSLVYEDDIYADMSEEDQRRIFAKLFDAKLTISWSDA